MNHYFRDYDVASKRTVVNFAAKDVINNEVHLREEVLDALLEGLMRERTERDMVHRSSRDFERDVYLHEWKNE
jgi:hypothetical protein